MMTVFPTSCKAFKTVIRRCVSRGCNPMLGSSKIYMEPTKVLPNEVAKLIRCDSPPLSELLKRFKVRYPKPTSSRNCKRLKISVKILFATAASVSLSWMVLKKAKLSFTGIKTISVTDRPVIFMKLASALSRVPKHSGHKVFPRKRDNITRY